MVIIIAVVVNQNHYNLKHSQQRRLAKSDLLISYNLRFEMIMDGEKEEWAKKLRMELEFLCKGSIENTPFSAS